MLFTFGYSGRKVDDLEAWLSRLDATIVDTRFQPMARDATWRKGPLEKRLGSRYTYGGHLLGNVNYKNGGEIKLADEAQGVSWLVVRQMRGEADVLLCVCKDPIGCHRTYIAELVKRQTALPWYDLNSPIDLAEALTLGHLPPCEASE